MEWVNNCFFRRKIHRSRVPNHRMKPALHHHSFRQLAHQVYQPAHQVHQPNANTMMTTMTTMMTIVIMASSRKSQNWTTMPGHQTPTPMMTMIAAAIRKMNLTFEDLTVHFSTILICSTSDLQHRSYQSKICHIIFAAFDVVQHMCNHLTKTAMLHETSRVAKCCSHFVVSILYDFLCMSYVYCMLSKFSIKNNKKNRFSYRSKTQCYANESQ